jgi:Apoptosis-antagonizing transcription factor, C-terminal
MANFMVPVPTIAEGWHEEKIDELFASLLGKRASTLEDGTFPTDMPSSVAQDGFRIFG